MTKLGPVMIDIDGIELTPDDRTLLKNPLTGGVILFTRNFESPAQVSHLINEIKSLREPSLLIAIDHEGGRVQRFKEPFTHIPALNILGQRYDVEPETALQHARTFGWLTAIELLTFNIDFSFTPVLDVDYGISNVIGNRAFHQQPGIIAKLAAAYIDGLHDAGMASTGKHFPGHGGVSADSHTDIPVDKRPLNILLENDIVPFEQLIPQHLDAIMPAHVIYEAITKEPAGFSSFWLKEILREKLKFEGVIFSDDLDMKGASSISDSYTVRAETALNAGCDMVLVCNNRKAAIEVLENLDFTISEQSYHRLLKMRGRTILNTEYTVSEQWDKLVETDAWQQAVKIISEYM